MNSLFPNIPVSKSPRLLWMERHGITLQPNPENEEKPFMAEMWKKGWGGIESRIHMLGKTEDDALTALAKAAGLKLWNEEGA